MASITGQIDNAARRYGIPTSLFRTLVKWESGGNAGIVSPAGAIGLTQLMPGTAQRLGVNPWDPRQNLLGGARYLREQFDRFGSWDLALAAYNAGPGAVSKYNGIPPYSETQRYVHGILSAAKVPTAVPSSAPFAATANEPIQGTPDLSSAAFANLSPGLTPLEQLSNLTAAVAGAGGPHTIESAEPMPAGLQNIAHRGPIKFQGVSLRGTNPMFAQRVSQAAAAVGATAIRLISARRTPATNTGVKDSNHLYGHAFDGEALINGQWVPLGTALKPVAARFGLRSGDVPGFYKGGPDVEHVDDGFNVKHGI